MRSVVNKHDGALIILKPMRTNDCVQYYSDGFINFEYIIKFLQTLS